MKKFYLMAVSALLLSSCSKEDSGIDTSAGGEIVKFTSAISGTDAVQTRADGDGNLTHFPELAEGGGRYLAVFMDVDGEKTGTKNTLRSDANGNLYLRDNAIFMFPESGGTVSFYSVWPNSYELGTLGQEFPNKTLEYTAATDSKKEFYLSGNNAELSDNDIMLAVHQGVNTNPVTLKYFHLMSNISVALKVGNNTNESELKNLVVRVHVPRSKVKLDYTALKSSLAGIKDLSQVTDWSGFLGLGGWSDGDFIFKIDTHVTASGTDYANYGRAFVGSMYEITTANQQYAYIEILKSGYTPENNEYTNASDYQIATVQIPVGTKLQPNKRYIFNITVNKTANARSGEASYSVASSEMLIQDCSTGEIVK